MNDICLKTQGQGTRLDGPSQTHNPMGRSGAEEERRLAGACAEFEAIFVEMLFKSMRASVPESGVLSGGRAEALYTGMLDRQIALEMATGQGSVGLARRMQSRLTTMDAPAAGKGPKEGQKAG